MSIKAKISVDSSQLNNGLKKAQNQAATSGKKIKANLENAGKGFDSINKLGGKMGGVFKNVAQSIKGLVSPIGLAMAGIALAIQGAIKMWDFFTESAEQAAMKAKFAVDQTLQTATQASQQAKVDEEYFDRLSEINSLTQTTNELQIQAAAIIQVLTKRYGDLGLSVDKTTGKIIGLGEAQEKFLKRQQQIKIQEQEAKAAAALQQANQAVSEVTGGDIRDVSGNKDAAQKMNKAFRFSLHTGVLGHFQDKFSNFNQLYAGMDDAKGTKEAWAYEVFKQGSTFQDKIAYLQKQMDASNDKDQITNLQKIIVALKKAKAQSNKLSLIKENGGATPQEQLAQLKKLSESSLGENPDYKIQRTNLQKKNALTYFSRDTKDEKARLKAVEATEDAKKAKLQKLESMQLKVDNVKLQESQLMNNINDMQQNADHQKNLKSDEAYRKKYADLLKQYKYVKEKTRSIEKQKNQIQTGIKDDENTLYKLKEQPAKKFKQSIKISAQTEIDAIDKLLGKEKEVLKAQALRNAQKAKGAALTDEQKKKVSDLADLQWNLKNQMQNKLNFGDLGIKTNELTRRGGFASGAVKPDINNVNNAIKKYNQQQVSLLTQIRDKLNNGGYI